MNNHQHETARWVVLFFILLFAHQTAHAVTIETMPIGNPGNAGDVQSEGTFGSVGYNYRIGKYEITNAQYAEFLNGVDPTGANTLALYGSLMSSDARGGINYNGGAANGSKYEIKPGRDNNPVVWVSWYDSIRFANWLHNGQGTGNTEDGAYGLLGGSATPSNGNSITRNPGAKWWLPSEDEWYKAAYHKNDGATGNYWDYPTSTDAIPYSDQPPGGGAPDPSNTANFYKDDGIANGYDDAFAVTGSSLVNDALNYLTDVGAYTSALGPYGTFDQGGNVWEWNDTLTPSSVRGLSGSSWAYTSSFMHASHRISDDPRTEYIDIGFRVATIPEPEDFGDYNRDGSIDAADYVTWRKNDGMPTGYQLWRHNFGTSLGTGSTLRTPVPEPAAVLLLSIAAMSLLVSPRATLYRW